MIPLLITEHYFVKTSRYKDAETLGQIRHRQGSGRSKVDFWQVSKDRHTWYGQFDTREAAEAELAEKKE